MTDQIIATETEQAWLDLVGGKTTNGLCPACQGREFIKQDDGTAVSCDCKKDRMLASYYEEAGIPREFWNMTLESHWNLKQDAFGQNLVANRMTKKELIGALAAKYKKALPAICAGVPLVIQQMYGQQPVKVDSLRLIGQESSGKSLIAALIAMSAVRNGLQTKFWNWTELCDILSPYPRDSEQQEAQSQTKIDFATKMFVVVDDITEYGNGGPNLSFNLDHIAKMRMNNKLPSIFTHQGEYTNTRLNHNWHSIVNKAFSVRLQ